MNYFFFFYIVITGFYVSLFTLLSLLVVIWVYKMVERGRVRKRLYAGVKSVVKKARVSQIIERRGW